MIAMLEGTVEAVDVASVLIMVHGVGYEVRMPSGDLAAIHAGQTVRVHASMQVSQDAITLYGFLSMASKRMFAQLQKVSGVGPKVALSLLSTLSSQALAQAVSDGDAAALAKAPGLGKKGAQKIILELKGSIDVTQLEQSTSNTGGETRVADAGSEQVVEGLMSLGWKQQDAQYAVRQACQEHDIATPIAAQDVPAVLRYALTLLDRGR